MYRSKLSRRSAIKGAALAGGAFAASRVAPAFAQATPDASPLATPTAEIPAFSSAVAERASGEVRLATAGNNIEQAIVQQQVDAFAAKYPNITVKYEPIPAEYLTKIQTDIAAGTASDVFIVQNEFGQDFMSRDVLLPIDDYLTEDGVNKDDFYAPLINAYVWQDQLYGLLKDWSPIGAVYDPAPFDAAGLAFPTTWEESTTTFQALKDASGVAPLILNPQFDRFVAFLYQAGGNITNADVTEITLGAPEVLAALDYYYGLYTAGLSDTSANIGADWPGDAFYKSLATVAYEGNWMFPGLKETAPDKVFAVAELPAGPAGKGTPAFTQAFSIYKGSQNPDAAFALINFLSSAEGSAISMPNGLAVPSVRSLEPAFLELFPERAPYIAAGEYATVVQYGPGGQQFGSDANAVLEQLWAGSIDTAEAQAQIVTAAENNITLTGAS